MDPAVFYALMPSLAELASVQCPFKQATLIAGLGLLRDHFNRHSVVYAMNCWLADAATMPCCDVTVKLRNAIAYVHLMPLPPDVHVRILQSLPTCISSHHYYVSEVSFV